MGKIKIQLVDYSENAVVIFGNTYPVRETLGKNGLKGTFKSALDHPEAGFKLPGWLFSKKRQPEIEETFGAMPSVGLVNSIVDTFENYPNENPTKRVRPEE